MLLRHGGELRLIEFTGKLKKVIWRSLENDFTIAAFTPETGPEFIATGDLFNPAVGITYEMSGDWTEHAKYGKQFKIDSYCVKEPVAADSIAVYLEKHVKGIGPVLADKLIEKYGKHTIRLLKKAPERVSNENKGISYKLALQISEQLNENDKRQDILIKLEGLFLKIKGLPKRLASDLLNIYGLTAFEIVKENPYVLTEMNRIGFLSADKIALTCGVKENDALRIMHGISYVIRKIVQETGDVWVHPDMIAEKLSEFIKGVNIFTTILRLINNGILTERKGFVTLTSFSFDEDLIADCIVKFLS